MIIGVSSLYDTIRADRVVRPYGFYRESFGLAVGRPAHVQRKCPWGTGRRRSPIDFHLLCGGVRVPVERSVTNALGVHPALRFLPRVSCHVVGAAICRPRRGTRAPPYTLILRGNTPCLVQPEFLLQQFAGYCDGIGVSVLLHNALELFFRVVLKIHEELLAGRGGILCCRGFIKLILSALGTFINCQW